MFVQHARSVLATNWWPGGGDGAEAPELRPGLREEDITPGILGFLFTALMAALLIVVVRDMVKRMRRMKYLSQAQAEQLGEEPEFPAEVVPAETSAAQQQAQRNAAAARFGPAGTHNDEVDAAAEAPNAEHIPHAEHNAAAKPNTAAQTADQLNSEAEAAAKPPAERD